MSKPMIELRRAGLVLSLLLTVAACEVRGVGEEAGTQPAEQVVPAGVATATSAPTAQPSASILRDDEDMPPGPETVTLTEPVALTIPFPDGSDIGPAAERQLEALLQEAAIDESWPVILAGHTDSGGNDQANLRSSRARAEAVAAWLVERGVADSRIRIVAFGEQNPIAPNALPDGRPNESGRRTNRRVEVRIAPPPVESNRTGIDQGA